MARRYSRDNRGRFAPTGSGATARGGRLRTAAGNKRATVTAKVSGGRAKGTMAKPKGLKTESSSRLKTGLTINKQRRVNAKLNAKRPDQAEVNIKGRFSGQAGKRMDASIDRAVKQVKASNLARLMKPKEQVKAERAANAEAKRQAAAAKPKRVRSVESQRMSRAKQVEKRRGMNISNPAGERQDSAGRMAANAARTQQRATAFLKAKVKPTATPKPAAAPKPKRRVFIRGNFRPQNVMANPAPDKTKYYKNQKGKNIAELEAIAKKAGANTQVVTKRKQNLAVAMAFKPMNLVRLNKASDFYANPRQAMRAQRRMGQLSTTDPRGVAFHELGHLRQKKKSENIFTQREFSSPRNARLAGRVSQYAKTNANEFAAETYAGLKTGRRYDSQVMRAYRQEMGLRPLSIRRQLKRKPNP